MTDPGLISALEIAVNSLCDLHRELAAVLVLEKRAKASAWASAEGGSEKAREKLADYQSIDFTCEALNIKGEIAALIEERDLLRLKIDIERGKEAAG